MTIHTQPKDFDAVAKTWDEKPHRIKLALDIASAIHGEIPLAKDLDVLDFGCGTGLLSLALAPSVNRVTGADTSRGMLDMLEAKIRQTGSRNIQTHLLDQDGLGLPPGPFGLIVSAMTMHHIKDPLLALTRIRATAAPGAWLALADLEPEQGLFHEDNQGVFHFGFAGDVLGQLLAQAGFGLVSLKTATQVVKSFAGQDRPQSFGVFLAVGQAL